MEAELQVEEAKLSVGQQPLGWHLVEQRVLGDIERECLKKYAGVTKFKAADILFFLHFISGRDTHTHT